MHRLIRLACLAVAAAVADADALAQAPAPPPVPLTVSARDIHVRDGRLSGATFTITSHVTGFTLTLVSGEDGTALGPPLMPGPYTIAVAVPGYETLVARNYCIEPGAPARFSAGLSRNDRPKQLPPPTAVDQSIVITPRPEPAIDVMTPAEIQAALEAGRAFPKLAAPSLDGRRTGRIFTPFWRIATIAQVADASVRPRSTGERESGGGQTTERRFKESEIPTAFIQRLAWVVGDPVGKDSYSPDADATLHTIVAVSDIAIRPKDAGDATRDIHPAWKMFLTTWCDEEALSSVLGRQFRLPSMVAAFPMDALQPGNTILFTYSTFAATSNPFRGVRVRATTRRVKIGNDDLRKWNSPAR